MSTQDTIHPCCNSPYDTWKTFGIDSDTTPEVFHKTWHSSPRGTPNYCIHALALAILQNNTPFIRRIVIKNRALLHANSLYDWTCLAVSLHFNQYEAASVLLELGADPNKSTDLMQLAAEKTNTNFVLLLAQYGTHATSPLEETAVRKAKAKFTVELRSTSLFSVDVQAKIFGYLFAPRSHYRELSQHIIEKYIAPFLHIAFPPPEPDRSCCYAPGWPLFGITSGEVLPETFDEDWESEPRGSPTYCIHTVLAAVFKSNILMIHHIIHKVPALLNSTDNERGWTPLLASILLRKYESACTLLKLGADPNILPECNGRVDVPRGATHLGVAVEKIKDPRFVELLLDYRAR